MTDKEPTYRGTRIPGKGLVLTPDGKQLPLRLDLVNHSPDGFEWGYAGSGPAQLALALLAHATGDDEFALKHYQEFKVGVVQHLAKSEWTLTEDHVRETTSFEGVTPRKEKEEA